MRPPADRALNDVLTKALVDAWQTKTEPCALSAQHERKDQFCHFGRQVSLTTAVEARFVNTLKWRTRLRFADNQPWTQIQKTIVLVSNGF